MIDRLEVPFFMNAYEFNYEDAANLCEKLGVTFEVTEKDFYENIYMGVEEEIMFGGEIFKAKMVAARTPNMRGVKYYCYDEIMNMFEEDTKSPNEALYKARIAELEATIKAQEEEIKGLKKTVEVPEEGSFNPSVGVYFTDYLIKTFNHTDIEHNYKEDLEIYQKILFILDRFAERYPLMDNTESYVVFLDDDGLYKYEWVPYGFITDYNNRKMSKEAAKEAVIYLNSLFDNEEKKL